MPYPVFTCLPKLQCETALHAAADLILNILKVPYETEMQNGEFFKESSNINYFY